MRKKIADLLKIGGITFLSSSAGMVIGQLLVRPHQLFTTPRELFISVACIVGCSIESMALYPVVIWWEKRCVRRRHLIIEFVE
jgi:hypothetical protein